MASESVHMICTSPPYWGLRDYGIPPTIWGGDLAWVGALGLEPTIDLYVTHMVEVFRAVRRVLRKDGTLWLNLGDSYATGGNIGRKDTTPEALARRAEIYGTGSGAGSLVGKGAAKPKAEGIKSKDLCGIPWRVAFALQADGWWLRQDIIWHKPNPMPESVTDRCTKAHEYLFLFAKSERYFYDAEAIREPAEHRDYDSWDERKANGEPMRRGFDAAMRPGNNAGLAPHSSGRNKRSVWEIATSPWPEAHFATFPPALVEPCILAASAKGCCAKCGAPWEREIERKSIAGRPNSNSIRGSSPSSNRAVTPQRGCIYSESETLGWRPTCKCDAAVVPATVLDPFAGAGTTGLVADRLQRNSILIELNPTYAAMARHRLTNDAPLFAEVTSGGRIHGVRLT